MNHKNKVSYFGLGLLFILIFSLISCNNNSVSIVLVSRHQEDTASLNPSRMRVSADLALNWYKRNNINTQIKYLYHSYYESDPGQASRLQAILENDKSIIALIGDIASQQTAPLIELASKFKIPHISFYATDDSLFTPDSWSFSYRPTQEHETIAIFSFIETNSFKNIAIISNSLSNIKQRYNSFQNLLSKTEFSLVYSTVLADTIDHTSVIQSCITSKPDVVIAFLTSASIKDFLQQYNLFNTSIPILLTPISMNPETILQTLNFEGTIFGLAPETLYAVQTANQDSLSYFNQSYPIAMGTDRIDMSAVWTFDGFLLLFELLDKTKNTRDRRQALLNEFASYKGSRLPGYLSFSGKRLLAEYTYKTVKLEKGKLMDYVSEK